MLDVVHFQRRPRPGQFSVERLFADVRMAMPPDVRVTLRINRFVSKGVFGRIADAFSAWWHRGAVNHILGDVHYLAWLLPRRNTVLTVLDCVSLERLQGVRRRLFWVLWYWGPVRRSAHVTVISEFSRDALQHWVRFPLDRIHVIPPPISPEFKRLPPPSCESLPRLLQVGTGANKNLARVIEAIQGIPAIFVVVGRLDVNMHASLQRHGINYEHFVDLDRAQLLEQYRQAHIVILASTYEGFGLPIIEAQAVGRPVVAGNICAMPEAAGGAACIVDPFDPADIRRGIRRVLDDSRYASALVERGFKNAARYSVERVASQYAGVYRSIQRGLEGE